ncbi:MAG: TAXI family TRAP transporter solute-binding subunit [Candidatus Hydrogenedentota bacterium]|nr:MAG: TAXI family TRAP transporter solute-binding subunit [Candidatus Hydrogenedentota bacterium]
MPSAGEARQNGRKRLLVIGIPVAIVLAVLFITLGYMKPAVPKEVYLLTGARGATHYEYCEQYARFLREHGITAHVVETANAFDNLHRLVSGENPMAGFVPAGVERMVEEPMDVENLVSLGSLYLEPLWLFTRTGMAVTQLADLKGKKVALGPKGTGPYVVARLLFHANRIENQVITGTFEELNPDKAADALIAGKIDAAFFVGEPRLPVIARLLESEMAVPVSFTRAAAYASLYPELTEVVVPEGAFDPARDIPGTDIQLIASAVNLVTRADLHPAIVDLLLDAAKSIHRRTSPSARRGVFPSMEHVSLPLSPAAIRYYEEGPSFLRRILPFWAATLVDRFTVVVVPVLTVTFALFKSVPALMQLRFSIQLQGFYRRLEGVEQSLGGEADRELLMKQLDDLERVSAKISVPRSNIAQYFEFRQNIHDTRARVATL